MSILEFVLILIAVYFTARISIFLTKRIKLIISVLRLGQIPGVTVEISYLPAFLLPRITARAAARVTVRGKVYSVRIYNGRGNLFSVHFANEKYSSVFLKTAGAVKARVFGRRVARVQVIDEGTSVYFPKTVIIPKRIDDSFDEAVMIFNPAPKELTYVSNEKTSIKVAFTGDTVLGERIFTKTSFANFIDRDSRGFFDKPNGR